MILFRHAVRLVVREPRRTLAALVGIAIAAGLVSSVLLFGSASGGTVTRRALAEVAVDAQLVLAPGADPAAATAILQHDPAVRVVAPFDLVQFDSAAATRSGTATQTSAGVLIGIDPSYPASTGLFGLSSGSLAAGQVAISRDLASNLGAVPGDRIAFRLPGGAAIPLVVSGVVSTSGADLVLGPLDAAHRAAGANPPANVAVMSRRDLASLVLPRVPAGATAAEPAGAGGAGGLGAAGPGTSPGIGSPVSASEPAVQHELHVRLDHAQLPGDPTGAQQWLDTVRRRIERQGAGAFQVVDDASASLAPVATDLVWGQILFVFLALPGIALALALSRLAADATADATRRHAGLLRARGARPRQLAAIFTTATVLTALVGSSLGGVAGAFAALAIFGRDLGPGEAAGALVRAIGLALLLTTLLASLAAVLPLRTQLREEIAASRQELQRVRAPLWQRLYLDLLALAAAAGVYVLAGGAVHPVLNAEGNATVTLALTSFLAPLLFWSGGTLLLLRVVGALIRRSGRLNRALGAALGPGGRLAGTSLAARATAASRAIVILALAVSFATSVLVFDATYRQQQRVDAELTLGADIKAVPTKPVELGIARGIGGPGISGAIPFVDRVAYVGPEAQDLLAVDATTLPAVAPLRDTFFQGTTAAGAMDALRSRPDAILVSAETAKDYSIVPGDRMRLRLPDAKGNLMPVDFHMAGIALEFPTAPKDAFLVANLSYVAAATGDRRISFVLARADGDVTAASRQLGTRLGADWLVTDLATTDARLANGITSVDLGGLVLIDVAFALLIAAVGATLFLLAGLAERRRELATLVAIGAEPGQVRASILGETLVVAVAGIGAGLLTGGLVGVALLQILAGVFDPPADLPVVPVLRLLSLVGGVAVALALALAVADRGLARLSVVAALRER